MAVRLGVPPTIGDASLVRRLAWTTAGRLAVLIVALGAVVFLNVSRGFDVGSATVQSVVATLAGGFGLTVVYAAVLGTGRALPLLADAQIICDQLIWTVLVYLTGGTASGATSFYGLTCLLGTFLTGVRGAALAGVSGFFLYAGLVSALHEGFIVPPADQSAALYRVTNEEVVSYVVLNGLVFIVVTLLAAYLAERLRTAGGRVVEAEERADRAERMAALGRLAAGLAHEIRNPLGSISGSIQLLRTNPALSDEDRQLCDIVQREAARLNDLVTDMMNVAKPRKPEFAAVDVSAIAQEVVGLAGRSGRGASDVRVVFQGEGTLVVRADGAQLRQLVWNLVRNAVQASTAGDVVIVRVEIGAQNVVVLSVEDQGVGLDEAAKKRLFDAFFTTRSHGTGIGLAVVKRIADDHGFRIDVASEQGRGATFRVELGPPLRESPAQTPPGVPSSFPPPAPASDSA